MRKSVQRKPRDRFKAVLRKIMLALMAVLVAFPVLYLFSSSLFAPRDFGTCASSRRLPGGATTQRSSHWGISGVRYSIQ